jgi:hypothetical protein
MKPSVEVSTRLFHTLQSELGAGYDVLVQPAADSINGIPIVGRPSYVVHDRERGSNTIVEVTGSWLDDELPVGAAAWALNVCKKNKALNPHLILVSTSQVHEMIRDVLAKNGVELIVTDKPAEAVSRVTSLIRAAA